MKVYVAVLLMCIICFQAPQVLGARIKRGHRCSLGLPGSCFEPAGPCKTAHCPAGYKCFPCLDCVSFVCKKVQLHG